MITTTLGLSDSLAGRDGHGAAEGWHRADGPGNLYERVFSAHLPLPKMPATSPSSVPAAGIPQDAAGMFRAVRPNIVQSIRAYRVPELAEAAQQLGQHFLYSGCADARTRIEVLDTLAADFLMPRQAARTFDALRDSLTETLHQAGAQPGFVIVLEGLPCTPRFDKEARESLLDVFRDAADFWSELKVPFRVFYAFA